MNTISSLFYTRFMDACVFLIDDDFFIYWVRGYYLDGNYSEIIIQIIISFAFSFAFSLLFRLHVEFLILHRFYGRT